MSHTRQFGDAPLKFLDVRSAVGKPFAVENVFNARQESAAFAQVRRTDVKRLGERRLSAEEGQIRHSCFVHTRHALEP